MKAHAASSGLTSPLWAPGYYNGYYDYDPGYAYGPGYDAYYGAPGPYVAQAPAVGGGSEAYCAQRFRSYDPASGTYLGFDGIRHPCP